MLYDDVCRLIAEFAETKYEVVPYKDHMAIHRLFHSSRHIHITALVLSFLLIARDGAAVLRYLD